MEKNYDILIIGGGPAGLTAALYAARSGYKTAVIEKFTAGGQMNITPDIANYPSHTSISGYELSEKMAEQAVAAGAELIYDTVTKLDLGDTKRACTSQDVFVSKAVILAMGAATKQLGIKGEAELVGSGVSYCATCDGAFFKGKDVAVVGGAGLARADVKYLSNLVNKLYVIFGGKLAEGFDYPNVIKLENTAVTNLEGMPLSGITVIGEGGEEKNISVSGMFVAVGYEPNTQLVRNLIKLSDKGYITADANMQTSIEGVFAAGDILDKTLRQIVTACADGATAAHFAGKFIKNIKKKL